MSPLLYVAIIFISAFVLIKAVTLFIGSSTKLAKHLGISEFTISFLLVAIATSLPETVVGITSAINDKTLLAYGDAVGANINLITLILAAPLLLGTTISTRFVINSKDVYYSILFAFLPIFLAIDGKISRVDGIILLGSYLVYTFTVIRRSRGLEKLLKTFDHTNLVKEGFLFLVSLVLLLGASEGIVKSALRISGSLGWEIGFVGLTLTAFGTSLPELAYAIGTIKRDQQDEVLGNVIGSVVVNSTFVLGITSMIRPIILKGTDFGASTILFLIVALLLFLNFSKSKQRLDRKEGVILFVLYVTFIVLQYKLQG